MTGDEQMQSYLREDGDRDLSFDRCAYCGCMMVWLGHEKFAGPEIKMGVNCRMLPKDDIEGIVRRLSPGP